MVNKKVTCYSVNIPESMDFVQLLLDNEESSLKPFVLDQYRTIELKYTQIQKNGSIVGLFVTTSRKIFHRLINLEMETIIQHCP